MAEVNFKYNGTETIIQCKIEDKLNDVCEKFCIKRKNEINEVIFIYGVEILNLDLKLIEVANQIDKQNLKIDVLVYDKNSTIIEENDRTKNSEEIICPTCGAQCLIDYTDYKISLNNCKNNHEEIISIKEFEKTQRIDEDKILCGVCNIYNKKNSQNNQFYRCGTCDKNICLICKENHNKEHILIDYKSRNYICHKHNEKFVSFCDFCKQNLCLQCELEHSNNHKIINYVEIIPNIDVNNIKNKIKELKDIIHRFNNDIDIIMTILQNIKMNLEKYYKINNSIIDGVLLFSIFNFSRGQDNFKLSKILNNYVF